MSRSALVTGAYGLLGAWLVRALLDRGERVTVIRRDGSRRSALVLDRLEERCAVVDGDVLDLALIDCVLDEHEIDTVFHLAAKYVDPLAPGSPVSTFDVNIRGTWTVLEACRARGVARTVVASSEKAYGRQPVLPYTEEMPLLATAPYDVSKAAADTLARSYWTHYGLPVAVARLANVYGGGDLNHTRLVPEAVAAVLEGRPPVVRSDGSPARDFLYVEDAVAAYLAIADAIGVGGAAGEAFNAGGETVHRVADVLALVSQVAGAGLAPDIRGTGAPPGELERACVDSSKLTALTGWRPVVALEDGLTRTVSWHRAHLAALA